MAEGHGHHFAVYPSDSPQFGGVCELGGTSNGILPEIRNTQR
jgi:hypothetical protein